MAAAFEIGPTTRSNDDYRADDDSLRRGLPTAHRVYGEQVVAATGGALQNLAFLSLADAAALEPALTERLPAVVRRLAAAAGADGMVGGQFLDLVAEGTTPDAAGLEAIHRAKTAALLSASCALGGECAGAEPEVVDALAHYGTHLGLAFQIVDDLLDGTGDPTLTGGFVCRRRAGQARTRRARVSQSPISRDAADAPRGADASSHQVSTCCSRPSIVVDRIH